MRWSRSTSPVAMTTLTLRPGPRRPADRTDDGRSQQRHWLTPTVTPTGTDLSGHSWTPHARRPGTGPTETGPALDPLGLKSGSSAVRSHARSVPETARPYGRSRSTTAQRPANAQVNGAQLSREAHRTSSKLVLCGSAALSRARLLSSPRRARPGDRPHQSAEKPTWRNSGDRNPRQRAASRSNPTEDGPLRCGFTRSRSSAVVARAIVSWVVRGWDGPARLLRPRADWRPSCDRCFRTSRACDRSGYRTGRPLDPYSSRSRIDRAQ